VNLAFLIDKLRPGGGAQRHTLRLALGLRERGYGVRVICIEEAGAWGEALAAKGIPVRALGFPSVASPAGIAAIFALRRELRRERPDLLYALMLDANLIGPPAGWLAGVPVVSARRDTGFSLRRRALLGLRFANRFCTAFCSNSEAVRRAAIRQEGIAPARIAVLPSAVEPEAGSAGDRAGLGIAPGEFVVLCVGRFRPEKGHAVLLQAVARLKREAPPLRLLLAGGGEEESRLRALARELDLEAHITFLGMRDDVPRLLASADAAALLSDHDGMPNFLLEAMAAGLPIAASRAEGIVEAVEDGVQGLLVAPGDEEAAAAALRRLRDDRPLAARLGAAGRVRAAQRFSPQGEAEAYAAFFRSVQEGRA